MLSDYTVTTVVGAIVNVTAVDPESKQH